MQNVSGIVADEKVVNLPVFAVYVEFYVEIRCSLEVAICFRIKKNYQSNFQALPK